MGEETTETIQGRKDISRPRNSSRGHWLQLDASSRRKSQEEESTRLYAEDAFVEKGVIGVSFCWDRSERC